MFTSQVTTTSSLVRALFYRLWSNQASCLTPQPDHGGDGLSVLQRASQTAELGAPLQATLQSSDNESNQQRDTGCGHCGADTAECGRTVDLRLGATPRQATAAQTAGGQHWRAGPPPPGYVHRTVPPVPPPTRASLYIHQNTQAHTLQVEVVRVSERLAGRARFFLSAEKLSETENSENQRVRRTIPYATATGRAARGKRQAHKTNA